MHDTLVAGDLDGVRSALAKGADPEGRDALGYTALMRAADDATTAAGGVVGRVLGVQIGTRAASTTLVLY